MQGFKALYTCNDGYRLNGAEIQTCQTDRTWSESPPSCVPQNQTAAETTTVPLDLGIVVGTAVAVSVAFIVVVILTIIVCCVRRYLKREHELPTKGEESIEFSKLEK